MIVDDYNSIITRLMAEAKSAVLDDQRRQRSARAKQAWIDRRERASSKRPDAPS